MAPFQFWVRNLQGQSRCFTVSKDVITGKEVAALVEESEGIPSGLTRLVTGTQQLHDDSLLRADNHGLFPSCILLARLLGGKGGFGSLLRGSQSQKKTTNFDACRDMNGRRLRHVNSEKKLVEWQDQAKEREMEKQAAEQMKKEERELKQKVEKSAALAELREQTEDILDRVVDAVKDATSSKAVGKRKVEELAPVQVKRVRMFGILEDEEDEDSEEEMEPLERSNDAGPSGAGLEDDVGPSNAADDSAKDLSPETREPEQPAMMGQESKTVSSAKPDLSAGKAEDYGRPLNFDRFESAEQMEALGLERLKEELQERGLKCGGSLSERAARLFLLKSTPIEKLDKKLFAKPPSGKK